MRLKEQSLPPFLEISFAESQAEFDRYYGLHGKMFRPHSMGPQCDHVPMSFSPVLIRAAGGMRRLLKTWQEDKPAPAPAPDQPTRSMVGCDITSCDENARWRFRLSPIAGWLYRCDVHVPHFGEREPVEQPAPALPDPKNPKVGDRFEFAFGVATVMQEEAVPFTAWGRAVRVMSDVGMLTWHLNLPVDKCVPLPPLPVLPEGAKPYPIGRAITPSGEVFYGRGIAALLDKAPAVATCSCADDEPGHLDPRCHLFVPPKKVESYWVDQRTGGPVCACLKCGSCMLHLARQGEAPHGEWAIKAKSIFPERRTPVVPYRRWDAMIGCWP